MMIDHLGAVGEQQTVQGMRREQRRTSKATLQNAAIGNAGIRVYDGGWIRIEDGGLQVTGTANVSGRLEGDGTLEWDGPSYFNGTTTVRGNFGTTGSATITGSTTISGSLNVSGPATLNNSLSVGSGQILAGDVTITPSGGGAVKVGNLQIDGDDGGTIRSGSTIYLEGSGLNSVRVVGQLSVSSLLCFQKITATELDVVGSKNFRMDHPTKPGHWLRHGSTESPVSGTEYTGRATIAANGEAVVELPQYFEGLNKPEGRTVQLTPVGRPFPVGADDIEDGQFIAYGEPGREVFWLVKAERFGGDFLLEEPVPPDSDEEVEPS